MDSYYKLRHGLWQITIVITVQSTIELLQSTTGIKFFKYQLIIVMIINVVRVGPHTHQLYKEFYSKFFLSRATLILLQSAKISLLFQIATIVITKCDRY